MAWNSYAHNIHFPYENYKIYDKAAEKLGYKILKYIHTN